MWRGKLAVGIRLSHQSPEEPIEECIPHSPLISYLGGDVLIRRLGQQFPLAIYFTQLPVCDDLDGWDQGAAEDSPRGRGYMYTYN